MVELLLLLFVRILLVGRLEVSRFSLRFLSLLFLEVSRLKAGPMCFYGKSINDRINLPYFESSIVYCTRQFYCETLIHSGCVMNESMKNEEIDS